MLSHACHSLLVSGIAKPPTLPSPGGAIGALTGRTEVIVMEYLVLVLLARVVLLLIQQASR